jgi:hypothetical protein
VVSLGGEILLVGAPFIIVIVGCISVSEQRAVFVFRVEVRKIGMLMGCLNRGSGSRMFHGTLVYMHKMPCIAQQCRRP